MEGFSGRSGILVGIIISMLSIAKAIATRNLELEWMLSANSKHPT